MDRIGAQQFFGHLLKVRVLDDFDVIRILVRFTALVTQAVPRRLCSVQLLGGEGAVDGHGALLFVLGQLRISEYHGRPQLFGGGEWPSIGHCRWWVKILPKGLDRTARLGLIVPVDAPD